MQRRRKEVWDGAKLQGSGDGNPPAGSRGGAPIGGLEDEVPQKLKNFYPRDVVSAVYPTATWLGGWLAGWLGVCHTPVLYQNG